MKDTFIGTDEQELEKYQGRVTYWHDRWKAALEDPFSYLYTDVDYLAGLFRLSSQQAAKYARRIGGAA